MILEWKKIKSIDDLPKDGASFLALWKGRICIGQYCDQENAFFISFDPAEYEASWKISKDRLSNFSHFIVLNYPDTYPDDFVSQK